MKKTILHIIFLASFIQSYSQHLTQKTKQKIDSLSNYVTDQTINDSLKGEALYKLGYTQFLKARDLAGASKSLFEALELAERKNLDELEAKCNDALGWMETRKENHYKAVEYMRKASDYYKTTNSKFYLFKADYNLGCMLMSADKDDEAKTHLTNALEFAKKIENKSWTLNSYQALAGLYQKIDKTDEAIAFGKESARLMQELKGTYGNGRIPSTLAELHAAKGDYKNANKWINEAFICANAGKDNMIFKEVYYTDFMIQKMQGNAQRALESYELYSHYKDSIFNDEAMNKASDAEAKYLNEVKKLEAEKTEAEKKLIESEKKRSDQQRNWLIGGVIFILIALGIVAQRFVLTKKQKSIIEKAHVELEEKNKEILDSISYAKRIQSAILPPNKLVKEYLQDSFILYKPKDIVAGDFYWLETISDENSTPNTQHSTTILFAAADCTGHGVPGAMVSVVCNNGLNRSVREHGLTDPGKILDKTREIVVAEFEKSEEEVKDGMDIALCSLEGNVLKYAGAHNPLWIIRSGTEDIEEIKPDKQPIGKTDNPQPYTTNTINLQKGDTIYIFSDGYADQFGGEKGKKMKTTNFKKLLISIKDDNMDKQQELIDKTFEDWKGDLEQLDDVCVIGVRI